MPQLLALPPEALLQIIRRCKSTDVMPVCKALRDIVRTHATTVTLLRPFMFPDDGTLVAAMSRSPALVRVVAPPSVLRSWHWPTGSLTQLQALEVPLGWAVDEVPPSLLRVTIVGSCEHPRDGRWISDLVDKLRGSASSCRVHARLVMVDANSTGALRWLDYPQLTVEAVVLCEPEAQQLLRVLSCADAIGLTSLSANDLNESVQLPAMCCGQGLTHLQLITNVGVVSLANACLPALQELVLSDGQTVTLETLAGAQLTALTRLELSDYESLASFRGLERAAVGALRVLAVSNARLGSLASLAAVQLPCLTRLHLAFCGLTALDGLASKSALQWVSMFGPKLVGLNGIVGDSFPELTKLEIAGANQMTSLDGLETVRLGSLESLSLRMCGFQTLRPLDRCDFSTLHSLDLSHNAQLTCMKHLPQLPRLRDLILHGCAHLDNLQPVVRAFPFLTFLDITATTMIVEDAMVGKGLRVVR